MLVKWLEGSSYMTKMDQMMGVIDSLGITDRRQLKIVTGWTENQIHGVLQRIRKKGEGFLRTWQPKHKSPFVYSLDEKGINHVRAMKEANLEYDKRTPKQGQVEHFMGTNEVLCRAIQAGYKIDTWLNGSETMSFLYYQLMPNKSPVKPDALIRVQGSSDALIEFDTGTESGWKIENKVQRYIKLSGMIAGGLILPVVWVVKTETRKQFIRRKAVDAIAKYKEKQKSPLPENLPKMYVFVQGEEVNFLAGKEESEDIMRPSTCTWGKVAANG